MSQQFFAMKATLVHGFLCLVLSLGFLSGCGQEGVDYPNGEAGMQPDETFLFLPKDTELNFAALGQYPQGSDASQFSLAEYDAIPLDANGSFEFEFTSEEGNTQYLSWGNKITASAGNGYCTYTYCDTMGTCGNWLTGYYGCCTHYTTTTVACNVN